MEAKMSDQNRDYAAIRRKVEAGVARQKWNYRIVFFVMHLIFYVVTMLAVWGTVAGNPQLRSVLFDNESGAKLIVLLPTFMWAAVILFHVASLYIETSAGEKAIRERFLMREVGEEILRKGLEDEALAEKPKRHGEALRELLSDDGELIPIDEDEGIEQSDYDARNHRVRS
jgi:hypothetical protein